MALIEKTRNLKNNTIMDNKLFIVCPFSCMEPFLQTKYGDDIFFLTYSGAVLQHQDLDYILDVKELIFRERIKTIYIVNDTSCRLINSIINRKKLFGLPSEKEIEELYIEHYYAAFKNQPLSIQQYKLAELNIRKQVNEMLNSPLLGSCISGFDIEVKGLITSKDKNLYKELQIENNFNKIYE